MLIERRAHVHDGRGPEVCRREFISATPANLDRGADSTSQPRGLYRGGAVVLAAVAAPSQGDDDADLFLPNVQRVRELFANAERALSAGPDGHTVCLPGRKRRARLERHVRDVRGRVGGREGDGRRRDRRLHVSGLVMERALPALFLDRM